MVLAQIPAGLFGSLQMFLCPDGGAEEECLDRWEEEESDGTYMGDANISINRVLGWGWID